MAVDRVSVALTALSGRLAEYDLSGIVLEGEAVRAIRGLLDRAAERSAELERAVYGARSRQRPRLAVVRRSDDNVVWLEERTRGKRGRNSA